MASQLLDDIEFQVSSNNATISGEYKDAFKKQTLLSIFKNTCYLYHNQIAIETPNSSITYKELDNLSEQYAHVIAGQLSITQSYIVVSAEPSILFYAVILGIIKSNNCFILVDPDTPVDRIETIIGLTRPSLILSDASHLSQFEQQLFIDDLSLTFGKLVNPSPLHACQPSDEAFIIFTSGTTGSPKGISVKHEGVANNLLSFSDNLAINSDTRLLQYASINFDATILEWGLTITNGATLIIPSYKKLIGNELEQSCYQQGVNTLLLTPTVAATLNPNALLGLESLLLCGESPPLNVINQWRHINLYNLYGPSEISIGCCIHKYIHDDPNSPIIGKPIANTFIILCDDKQNPVMPGMIGEICIGGLGVAHNCYVYTDSETSHAFIQFKLNNTFNRVYRSGDLGVLNDQEQLEFKGRMDQQIKIQGNRVEPEAIRNIIIKHADVLDCHIIVKHNDAGSPELHCYLIPSNNQHTHTLIKDLRQFIHTKLPIYMQPQYFYIAYELPRTINDKIDKQTLTKLAQKITPNQESSQPKNPLEDKILAIWKQVLGNDNITSTQHFIDCGGNSLTAITIAAQITHQLDVDCHNLLVFDYPTVTDLAAYLRTRKDQQSSIGAVQTYRAHTFALSARQRHIINSHSNMAHTNNILIPYKVEGTIQPEKLLTSLRNITQAHSILMSNIVWENNDYSFKINNHQTEHLLKIIQKPLMDEATFKTVYNSLFNKPINLAQDRLFKCYLLLDQQEDYYYLIIYIHHIIADLHSIELIENLLIKQYSNGSFTPTSSFLPQKTSRSDTVQWQKKLEGKTLRLAFNDHLTDLEADEVNATVEDITAINHFCSYHRITRFNFLLAIYSKALSTLFPQPQLGIAYIFSTRDASNINAINLLSNRGICVVDCHDNLDFEDLIGQCQSEIYFAHQYPNFDFKTLKQANLTSNLLIDYETYYETINLNESVSLQRLPLFNADKTGSAITLRCSEIKDRNTMLITLRYQKYKFDQEVMNDMVKLICDYIHQQTQDFAYDE